MIAKPGEVHGRAHQITRKLRGVREEAEEWLRRLAEMTPQKVEVWRELAELEVEIGSHDEAMTTIERGLKQNTVRRARDDPRKPSSKGRTW